MTATEPVHSALASRLMRRVPAVGLVLAGMLMFQFGAVLAVGLFDTVGPAGAAMLRLLWAALIMALLWHPLPWPPSSLSRDQVKSVLSLGFVVGTMNLCFYEALDRMPLGTTVAIQFVGPLAVAALGRRNSGDLVWVACAAVGVLALVGPGATGITTAGVAFAAIGAAAWGGYIVASARIGRTFTDARGLALGMVAACAIPLIPGAWSIAHGTSVTIGAIAIGLAVALLASVLPHTFDSEALRRLPANVFGVLMALEPALGLLLGIVFLSQTPTAREVAGIALVVVAAIGVMRGHTDPPVEAGISGP